MELSRATLSNVVTFGEVDLDLTRHPLVVISGRNLDSDTPNNRNGVGKSVLWGTLPILMYDNDPLSLTKRSSKKKALNDKESRIGFEWTHLGQKVKAALNSKNYFIEIDGVDMEVHKSRQEVGRDWIRKMFPLSQAEFYSYAYLTTQRPHPFQRVTGTERMKYIIDLFDLDIYDKLRANFSAKVSAAQKEADRAETLASELQVAEVELKTIKVTKEEVSEAEAREAKIRDQLMGDSGILAKIQKYREQRSAVKQRATLQARLDELDVESDDPEAEIAALEKLVDDLADYRSYLEAKEEYDESHAALTKKLKAIKVSSEPVSARVDEIRDRLTEIDEELDVADEVQEKRGELRARLKRLDAVLAEFVPDGDRESWEEERAAMRAIIKVAKEFGSEIVGSKKGCVCPTCRQDVDVAALKKSSLRAQKKLAEVDKALTYFDGVDTRAEVAAELKALPQMPNVKALKAEGRNLARELDELEKTEQLQRDRTEIQRELRALKAPRAVKKPATKLTAKEIKARGRALTTYIELRDQLAELPEYDVDVATLDSRIKVLDDKRTKLLAQSDKVAREVSTLRAAYLQKRSVLKTVRRLREELAASEDVMQRLKLYKVMQKAYAGDIKAQAVAEVLGMIEEQLNVLQSLAFPESMRFRLAVNSRNEVEAQAIRHDGRTSDIANLSGAESNCFALLWAVTMLVFAPEHKRPNFIILDEPDNTCSPGVREHLITEFLPKLMSIVPHVFWITPLDTDVFGEDVPKWTIVKSGGVSTVEESY
jgi:DNA repair exonuclease SbcCD ATPase subunit